MTVVVSLAKAVICFTGSCFPILYGVNTPTGEFEIAQRFVITPGYGGDVIQFYETDKEVFSIHRTWTGRPAEHRPQRYSSPNVKDHVISKGCINLEPKVYEKLLDCCVVSGNKLIIEK